MASNSSMRRSVSPGKSRAPVAAIDDYSEGDEEEHVSKWQINSFSNRLNIETIFLYDPLPVRGRSDIHPDTGSYGFRKKVRHYRKCSPNTVLKLSHRSQGGRNDSGNRL